MYRLSRYQILTRLSPRRHLPSDKPRKTTSRVKDSVLHRAYSEPEYGSIPPTDPYVPPRESTTIENTLAQLDTMLANRTSLEDTLVSVMHGMRDSSVTRSFKKPKVSDPEIRREPTQDGRCPHAVRAGYQTSAQPLPQR